MLCIILLQFKLRFSLTSSLTADICSIWQLYEWPSIVTTIKVHQQSTDGHINSLMNVGGLLT